MKSSLETATLDKGTLNPQDEETIKQTAATLYLAGADTVCSSNDVPRNIPYMVNRSDRWYIENIYTSNGLEFRRSMQGSTRAGCSARRKSPSGIR